MGGGKARTSRAEKQEDFGVVLNHYALVTAACVAADRTDSIGGIDFQMREMHAGLILRYPQPTSPTSLIDPAFQVRSRAP